MNSEKIIYHIPTGIYLATPISEADRMFMIKEAVNKVTGKRKRSEKTKLMTSTTR